MRRDCSGRILSSASALTITGSGAKPNRGPTFMPAKQKSAKSGGEAGTPRAGTPKVGTKDNPWKLKTPPGSSEFEAYRDETVDPAALVVTVGKTVLHYHLRAIEDLHAMLKTHGDWLPLGGAD